MSEAMGYGMKKTYADKLKDPRWQKMRLVILQRDNWRCTSCFSSTSTLHVHHRRYKRNAEPWEYDQSDLVTLCETCHENKSDFSESFDSICWEDKLLHFRRINGRMVVAFKEEVARPTSNLKRSLNPIEVTKLQFAIWKLLKSGHSKGTVFAAVLSIMECVFDNLFAEEESAS